ncbi:hypothetical protein QC761_210330 [Podospora bellae-mahoneyi]|uniref:Uncharacterized protein n=1 Tax=Podospora bellae-mahoneyi TaxID=2093777 RepID=A0ABR0FU78_9PEZI|nr:hypothetical protein QC761_210330 [Podospora bellae-mahoneyi]
MLLKSVILALATATGISQANPIAPRQGPTGNGPFAPAYYTTDSSLNGHTLYLPRNVPQGAKIPVLVWGNGACSANGLDFLNFLTQIASHGVFVISSGSPGGQGSTNAQMMTRAIDWVTNTATKQRYPWLETSRISVSGMSCGGVEAYTAGVNDNRVTTIGIYNSGLLSEQESRNVVPRINKPIFYFMGGPSDIAFNNVSVSSRMRVGKKLTEDQGERDYRLLPQSTPTWKGNLNVGHGGTYGDQNGGKFGVAAVRYYQWVLRGNATAANFFTNNQEASRDGWSVESRSLGNLRVNPI